MRDHEVLQLVHDLLRRPAADASLPALAARAGWSRFHLQRTFRRVMGESPKRYVLRLRLEDAAARLASSNASVLEVGLAAGFRSHEVFTRAFRRHFGCAPVHYRSFALRTSSPRVRVRHALLVKAIAPCVRLFRISTSTRKGVPMPMQSIVRKDIAPQPVLFIRRRVAAHEVQPALAECFGKLYGYATQKGLPIAGFPLCRYVSTGVGLWTIEPGVPLAAPAPGEGEMQAGELPGGPVAFAVHAGPYDELGISNAAVERWIEANGHRVGGAPWEWYVTDPGEHPNPADWKTEIYWPLAE
jgi:AraC family transcriptional regulator